MLRLKIGLVLIFAAVFVVACSQTDVPKTATSNSNSVANTTSIEASAEKSPEMPGDEHAAARKIYQQSCINCHKADGTGGISVVEGKNIKAPNLTSDRQKKEPDDEYVEIIENGAKEDGMPAYKGKISDEDIKNLVKYIRAEFQGK